MIYIIVVSHGHEDYIKKLIGNLNLIAGSYRLIVRDNKDSFALRMYLRDKPFVNYISGGAHGFGKNNNIAVKYALDNFNISSSDYFLFLNPDVIIEHAELMSLAGYIKFNDLTFSTISLYRDFEKKEHDYSVRNFPGLIDFAQSYIFGVNKTKIIKENVIERTVVDWCAGSFMFVRADAFLRVKGFDEKYFMYCEDVDFCYRMRLSGTVLNFLPQFCAIHYAHHDNRKFLSKAFRWHLKSTFRFIIRKKKLNMNNYSLVESVLRKYSLDK